MRGPEGDDRVDERFQAFGNEGLQDMALERKSEARPARRLRGMTGGGEGELAATDEAARRLNTGYAPGRIARDAGHFAMLEDVDAKLVGGACKTPGDGVVTRRAAASLQQ